MLIAFLAVIYAIGLSSLGIDNAILISILFAFLSLIPYVGNIIGLVLAISMAAFSGGQLGMYIGVAVTYFIAQFRRKLYLTTLCGGRKSAYQSHCDPIHRDFGRNDLGRCRNDLEYSTDRNF